MTQRAQRARGVIALLEQNCTVCMICVRECPVWCIHLDSHTEPGEGGGPGGRPRSRHVLDRFAIDYSLCMYCGICVQACPFDALFWSPEHDYASTDALGLLHERDRLASWLPSVPPSTLPSPAPGVAPGQGAGTPEEGTTSS